MPDDPYPRDIRFDFEHDRLRRYLRARWVLSWMTTFVGMGVFLSFIAVGETLEKAGSLTTDNAATCLRLLAIGAGTGFLLGAACYLVFSHWRAPGQANALSLRVEGAFLRITQGRLIKSDRKLHFRSITDYAVVEGPLRRRFGLKTLVMTTAGGSPASLIAVTGLRDCEAVRDQLAEIDATREQAHG